MRADVHLRIANRPTALTVETAMAELGLFLPRIRSMGQGFRSVWPAEDGETIVMELDLVPASASGVIPLSIVLRVFGPTPLIGDIRLYLDPTPLRLPLGSPYRISSWHGPQGATITGN